MDDQTKHQIGSAVRAARERAGQTQEELAQRIDRHADSISLVERGRTQPTLDMLLELSRALDVSLSDLVPGQPADAQMSPLRTRYEAEIRELVRAVPEARLEYVRDHLRLVLALK